MGTLILVYKIINRLVCIQGVLISNNRELLSNTTNIAASSCVYEKILMQYLALSYVVLTCPFMLYFPNSVLTIAYCNRAALIDERSDKSILL